MNIAIYILILFFICTGLTNAESEKIFVGLTYNGKLLPDGCNNEGGQMINSKNDDIAVDLMKCHGKHYAVLDRLSSRDGKGNPNWDIVDIAVLPKFHIGESLNDIDCTSPAGGYTLTLAKWHNTKKLIIADHVSYALRLNLEKSKFEVIKPNLVKCDQYDENEIRARE